MKHRLTADYARNYCNRTLIVLVIILENVVTCFFSGTQCFASVSVVVLRLLLSQSVIALIVDTLGTSQRRMFLCT